MRKSKKTRMSHKQRKVRKRYMDAVQQRTDNDPVCVTSYNEGLAIMRLAWLRPKKVGASHKSIIRNTAVRNGNKVRKHTDFSPETTEVILSGPNKGNVREY